MMSAVSAISRSTGSTAGNVNHGRITMTFNRAIAAVLLALWPTLVTAQPDDWRKYVVAESGANVDLPRSIFSREDATPPGGSGSRWLTADGRANLTVQSVANDGNETPAAFLQKKHPPRDIAYRRVTSSFFVVSGFRNGLIWYDRCNFAGRFITCVLINYPASEKKQWDSVVTRISNSLDHG
jgi:hypothetical protein